MFNLQKKLRIIKEKIKEWNRTVFGDIFKEKTRIEENLEQIHKDWASGHSNEEYAEQEKSLTPQWHDRCRQEETLWKQKSRIQWLKEGEQNTKFFHRSALDYRSGNKILEMKNKDGEPLKNHHDISSLLREHFNSIAQEPQLDREEAIKELLKAIHKSINSDQNWALCREITLGEVEEAVNSMPNNKAPGPNGFTINFYKPCWHIVKQEVWDVVEDSRRSRSILKSINSTFIALIPKVEEANTPEKFKPIALCNVIYKIISKVIANRLKPIFLGIISEEQSGYVEGRQILDNILLAQEMIHTLHSRKETGMLMQLDLSKAYDKVHQSQLLGFRIGNLPSRYLGAPLTLKHWQKTHRQKVIANMEKKCKHWTHRALNFASRLVLTKTVLQAIPQYLLSMLPAPKGILQQMRTIQRSFLWNGNGDKKKWVLVAWNKLCKPKYMGGLNLVDPSIVNRTCGAKLWWRWIKEHNLSWAKYWKEKYTPDCNNQDMVRLQEVPEGSPIWNLVHKNRSIVQENSFWEIRNGRIALFWEDAWQQLPKLDTPELSSLKLSNQNERRHIVHHYWNQNNRDPIWREWISLNNNKRNESTQKINDKLQKKKIRKAEEEDKLRWGMRGSGNFSLKEAREIIEKAEQEEAVPWSNKVWDSLFLPKIKTFLWLLMRNRTLTCDNLRKKGFSGPSRCPMCLAEEETINHLFNSCEGRINYGIGWRKF
eukprot:PITA_33970